MDYKHCFLFADLLQDPPKTTHTHNQLRTWIKELSMNTQQMSGGKDIHKNLKGL